MYKTAEQRLNRIINSREEDLFHESQFGLEKESLRVSDQGKIAQTPHPAALGSALTHPYITTDYSEALLELITPPLASISAALEFLQQTHQFVYSKLGNEILWSTSMPCIVTGEASIPIAYYGESHAGVMKTVYRRGLGYRYGKMMQVIAGVHFNYSLSDKFWRVYQDLEQDSRPLQDFISHSYFCMMRNLQRFGWLIPYLFGASPAVCKSFLKGVPTKLEQFDEYTYYEPYATSLRVGDIGYQNYKEGKSGIKANYDDLDAYIKSITHAIETLCPEYEKIGVKVDGQYRQLNANLLQIENEYYSSIRPKQLTGREEKPSLALKRRGVRYLELRSLDVNVYHPLGVHEQQLHFLEAFLIFCLLHDSPAISSDERNAIDKNLSTTAHRGRQPGLQLNRNNQAVSLSAWGQEICQAMESLCETLDEMKQVSVYSAALQAQLSLLHDADETPSAKILAEMRREKEAFFPFSMRYSQKHYHYFHSLELPSDIETLFGEETEKSMQQQRYLESAQEVSFDEYLERYFAQR
ncbi:MAG: glutamate--cysteine ligase [Gammaproteobacteria bacterium SG8_11]|nr:MAG: glutamate--cysteine ligase [Gammaproteobacteria bacterium SG8_11]